jgi:predicted DCC family thiol-disulfide oxidoreductase YuxK
MRAICLCMTRHHDPKAAAEVYYDGGCPICRREIAAYRRMEGMAAAVWRDVSAEEVPGLDRTAALARFQARQADGRLVSGAAAFLAVWRLSPRLAPMARILDRTPFRQGLEVGYCGFLRVRPLWRRRESPASTRR